jgi:hypothetical protein
VSIRGFIVRFDGENAILESTTGQPITVQRSLLPETVQLGDFIVENVKNGTYHVDVVISEERRKEILRMSDRYFE